MTRAMFLVSSVTFMAFGAGMSSAGPQASFEDAAGPGDAEPVYTSPSADGAYVGENFDDPWMFERDWVVAKGATSAVKQKERWRLLPAPGSDWPADLGLTLTVGCPYLSASRPLSRPLHLSRRPIVVQFQLRLPRQQQCAGVQLRLLTHSQDGLDRVNRTTPSSLLFAAESCADQVKLQLSLRSVDAGSERRAPSVAVAAGGASDQRPHRYRLLITAGDTAQLLIDDQPVKNISWRSLVEPESRRDGEATGGDTREGLKTDTPAANLSPNPADALNMELWSAAEGLFLDNLIITGSPEQASRFTPPAKPRRHEPVQRNMMDDLEWYCAYAAERPWMYAVLVLAIGVPACLLISCCLPESLDLEAQRRKAEALKKKTDEEPNGQQTRGSRLRPMQAGGLFGARPGGDRSRLLQSGQPRRRTLRRD